MVCSKSCLRGSSEQPTGRGNAFSSKIAAARDGFSASCKTQTLQKAAEILWRQRTKEIPAVGSKGCLRNSSCFPGDSLSLRVEYFQELFLCPLSCGLCFGGCIPCLCVLANVPPSPAWSHPWCQTQAPLPGVPMPVQSWAGWLEMSSALSCRKLWDGRLRVIEHPELEGREPAAEWSPGMFGSLLCLPPGLAS